MHTIARRHRRLLLWLAAISVLVAPAPRPATAQPEGPHFEAFVSDTVGLEGPTGLDHIRRDDGHAGEHAYHFVAERRDDHRRLECRVQFPEGHPVRFTARENIAEGRGFIHETTVEREPRGVGEYIHGDDIDLVMCHLDILPGGVYHRTLTVADVELSIRVRAVRLLTGEPVDFEHSYCIRGAIVVVPPWLYGEVRDDPRCTEPAGRGGEDVTHG